MAIPTDPAQTISQIATDLIKFKEKGDLGRYIASVSRRYGMYDLQIINGKIERDLRVIPYEYRKKILPYMREWIFGRYHTIMLMERTGKFPLPGSRITDIETFLSFCQMLPKGCQVTGDEYDPFPAEHAAWYHCFMYLMAAFAMYVQDEPGHPVGMPFPGGDTVRRSAGRYYCPIRDKEEEIFYSICNFCPALQDPGR